MADAEPVRVLPTSEVKALLTELAALFSTLPESLPVVEPAQSKYGRFLGFVPDLELLEERGVVGAVNTALERALRDRRDALKIIERIQKYLFIFTKLFSAMPNSMNDERTGSRMTFLYSKLRSRTDINTMVEQIQVKQWHQLIDEYVGNVKRPKKRGPLLKYRNISLEKTSRNREEQKNEGAIPVALNDEQGDDWLEPGVRSIDNDVSETESPSQSYDHLEFIDLKSTALIDFISDTAQTPGKATVQGGDKDLDNEQVVRKVADVDWDQVTKCI
ncbi:hypothetical protein RhiJN_27692 [Ceratobasidium sp. AG-Ba]|nr:hypothetical protein RhiJN_13661 [Ceratobasidium sp. AG-Ba]QRV99673.1 hypothetical protein RhiJN_27692 [Ceratobasidium sp. AG-Ba]QRW14214.1 hypothetical protein RhiLY_13213 [Ceratobasidium sp. AG-Ba]